MKRHVLLGLLAAFVASSALAVVAFFDDFTGFAGDGFDAAPVAGQLDSDLWKVGGLSDGAMAFGDTQLAGDFARGSSSGGVITGGVYAWDVDGDICFGVQPTAADFTPGSIVLRILNDTGAVVAAANIRYEICYFNDQGRANSLNFSYAVGADESAGYTSLPGLDFMSPEAADTPPVWQGAARTTLIANLALQDGEYLFMKWTGADVSGSGSRDEMGIDNVHVEWTGTVPTEESSWGNIKALYQ